MHKLLPFLFLIACQDPHIKADPKQLEPSLIKNEYITGTYTNTNKQRILLIGDSEVLYMDWFQKAIKRPNETLLFNSKPGTTIGTWNYIFKEEYQKYSNLDYVIIFLGTNNNGFKYLQPYQNILDEVKKSKVKCIFVGPTKVYNKHHVINDLLKNAITNDGTCKYFDTEEAEISLEDGVHPNAIGASKWLTEIWKVKDAL